MNYNYFALVASEAQIEQLEETVSTRGALIKRLQDAAAERKLTINSLQADLRDQESYISRLESSAAQHNAQIKELQAALARSQSQVQQLQASVADRDAHIGKLKWAAAQPYQSPSRITELQNSLADSQSHIKQLRAEVADRDTQIEKLKKAANPPASLRDLVDFSYNAGVANRTSWNEDLRNPCGNHRYIVQRYDEDLAAYDTDENGLVVRVQALLSRVYKYEERNTFRKKHKKDGRYAPDDESGHLIAALFGGCGEVINMVPMTYNLNRYEWRDLERGWQDYLNANPNCQMFVDIKVLYGNNNDGDDDSDDDDYYHEYDNNYDDMPFGRPTGFRVSQYRVGANGIESKPYARDVFDNTN